ncbi:MAG: hypothetical protein NVSMB18_36820 [Acetobacteraceae bacterium]
MRKTVLMSATLLGLAAAPAFAQSGGTSGQYPASPGAASQMPQPSNSLPAGGGNTAASAPSGDAGTAPMTPGMHRRHTAAMHGHRGRVAHRAAGADPMAEPAGGAAPADQYSGVPPTSAYQGGAGSPRSAAAANTSATNTRSLIAPRLPSPNAAGNSPRDYLAAAQRAIAANQTGAAQEALERAETRILTRSTDPAAANQPDDNSMIQAIASARRALANRNNAGARSAISAVLDRPGT